MLSDRFVWRGFGAALDLVPYIAVLAWPLAWFAWAMGAGGNVTAEEVEASWWFKGYVAMLLFVPSMLVCGIIEWRARRRGLWLVRPAVRVFRWVHTFVAFGPILAFAAYLALPPA